MHLAVSERSGDAEGLGGGPQHTTEIGVAVSYCAAVGSGSWDDVDHARGRQEQADGLAVAGALPCGRGIGGLQRDATRPGRKPPLTAEVMAEVVEKDAARKASGGDALEHPQDGSRGGPQPYQCEADLAWARTEASSHARLQAVDRISSLLRRCRISSASTSTRRTTPWCSALTRRARSRRSTAPSRGCR